MLNSYSGPDVSYIQIKTSDLKSEISPWMTVFVSILKAMILKSNFTVSLCTAAPEQLKIEAQSPDYLETKSEEVETNNDVEVNSVPIKVEDPLKKIIGEDNLVTPDNFHNLSAFDHFNVSLFALISYLLLGIESHYH